MTEDVKKKSRKRKDEAALIVASPDVEEETSGTKAKKSKKSRKGEKSGVDRADEVKDTEVEVKDTEVEEQKLKRRRKGRDHCENGPVEKQEGDIDTTSKQKRRKQKPVEDEAERITHTEDATRPHQAVLPDANEKRKKRKRDKAITEDAPVDQDIATQSQKPKRRKVSKHGFKNPAGDEALSEQASKALSYAYTQFEDPSSWKFNKARQNWLIRNIWSGEAVPSDYVSLVTRYLTGTQGGAREALIKVCRDLVKEPLTVDTPAKDDEPEKIAESSSHTPTDVNLVVRQQRARDLLSIMAANVE